MLIAPRVWLPYHGHFKALPGMPMPHPDPLLAIVPPGAATVFFQPVIDLRTDRVFAYEALLRVRGGGGQWISPIGALAAVNELPPARRLAAHRKILDRVLPCCLDAHADSGLAVAVNLPATLLEDARTVAALERCAGAGIVLEILETTAVKDMETVKRSLSILHDCGYGVAIDDYGTGYSTASLLAALPRVDIVKIDIVFVATERGRVMLPALCKVARAAGASVVVEGIETDASDRLVRAAGADYGQGFFYGVPASYETVRAARGTPPILMGTTRNAPIATC